MVKTEHGIVVWPDPVLDRPARPVTEFGKPLEALVRQMAEAMERAEGIGIAAAQVGVPLRLALIGRGDGTWFEVANPEIVSADEIVQPGEGCLSVPGEHEPVPRFRRVKVRYQDRAGRTHELQTEDRLAHVLQHEIDHLNGVVFVKRLSSLKRSLVRGRMVKLQRDLGRAAREESKSAERP